MYFIDTLLDAIAVLNRFEALFLIVLAVGYLLSLVFRIILYFAYQSQLLIVNSSSKKIKTKEDLKKMDARFLGRSARDYSELWHSGVVNIGTRAVVEKNETALNFLFWNYKSIGKFVSTFEKSFLILGFMLLLEGDNKNEKTLLLAGLFAVVWILSSFFDFEVVREKLINSTVFVLERDVAKFFPTDISSAIKNLSADIKGVMIMQVEGFDKSFEKINNDLKEIVKISLEKMAVTIEGSMSSLVRHGEVLDAPLQTMKNSIIAGAKMTEALKETAGILNKALSDMAIISKETVSGVSDVSKDLAMDMSAISSEMNETVSNFSVSMIKNSDSTNKQFVVLNSLLEEMNIVTKNLISKSDFFENNTAFILENQKVLNRTVSEYEIALQELAVQLGDGLGKIIEYHLHTAYSDLSDGLKKDIVDVNLANNRSLDRIHELFTQMQLQSKAETEAILRIKEQIEMK